MPAETPLFTGLNHRAASLLLDGLVVLMATIPAMWVGEVLAVSPGYLGLAVIAVYFIVLPATRWQGTVGKRANRIKIATLMGERVGLGRSALRFAASLVSWATLGLGFIACLWNARRRALHDYIAGTVVVDAQATRESIVAVVPPPVPWWKRIFGSALVLLVGWLPVYFFFEVMNTRLAWQVNARNQQAVEPIVQALEEYRARHGRFPPTLRELGPRPPALSERTALYYTASASADRCWLAIVYWLRPGFLPSDDVKEYDCAARSWEVKDFGELKASREGGFGGN